MTWMAWQRKVRHMWENSTRWDHMCDTEAAWPAQSRAEGVPWAHTGTTGRSSLQARLQLDPSRFWLMIPVCGWWMMIGSRLWGANLLSGSTAVIFWSFAETPHTPVLSCVLFTCFTLTQKVEWAGCEMLLEVQNPREIGAQESAWFPHVFSLTLKGI